MSSTEMSAGLTPEMPGRLPHRARTDALQLLLRLDAQPAKGEIVGVGRQHPVLELFGLLRLTALPGQISLVFDLDFHLFAHVARQRGDG